MGEEIEELPKAIVRRVVKEKLSECSDAGDISLHKDALLAFGESARIFIHYLSAAANDLCKESKRQTLNADDVLRAIEEIDFPEFLGPLRASLNDYRSKTSKKRAGATAAKESKKKRKEVVSLPADNNSHSENVEAEGNDDEVDNNDQEQQNDEDDDNKHDSEEGHKLQDYTDEEGEEDVDEQEQQNAPLEVEKDMEDAIVSDDSPGPQEDAGVGNTSEGNIVHHEEEVDAANEL